MKTENKEEKKEKSKFLKHGLQKNKALAMEGLGKIPFKPLSKKGMKLTK
jgi:hypothetical protein